MEETLASPKMAEIDFINKLERISSLIPNRILKLKGYIISMPFLGRTATWTRKTN